jgi:hypothetical protein
MRKAQLHLDLDGVLADFHSAAEALLKMPPAAYQERHGAAAFWRKLAAAPLFYGRLPLMPDAHELMAGVRHLRPVILTGVPVGGWAARQKYAWVQQHFPGVPVITTWARNKHRFCSPGDVLVDDQEHQRAPWQDAGGHFVHHTSATTSLLAIRASGLDVRMPS